MKVKYSVYVVKADNSTVLVSGQEKHKLLYQRLYSSTTYESADDEYERIKKCGASVMLAADFGAYKSNPISNSLYDIHGLIPIKESYRGSGDTSRIAKFKIVTGGGKEIVLSRTNRTMSEIVNRIDEEIENSFHVAVYRKYTPGKEKYKRIFDTSKLKSEISVERFTDNWSKLITASNN